jgi:hypothetical protein
MNERADPSRTGAGAPEILTDPVRIKDLAARWVPDLGRGRLPFRMITDTSDFFDVSYGSVVLLGGRPYLVRQNAKEGRFGIDDEVKHWVKRAVDLLSGEHRILKLVFYEKFLSRVGDIEFECFRSPKKEARILRLVAGHANFMQGTAVEDEKGNLIRVLETIFGPTLASRVEGMDLDHQTYFHERFPAILERFSESVAAIGFLHAHGEKHGDIRRDHLLVDRDTDRYRWIDFDYNYRHRENIYGYDLFGLGNILIFLAGRGDVRLHDLKRQDHPALARIGSDDLNIVFRHRVANLRTVYPYIPERLNRILLHFSRGARRFYEHSGQLLEDLQDYRAGS